MCIRDRCIDIQANNIEGIVGFSLEFSIDFVVIGPEVSLVLGLVDELEKLGIKAFGPTAGAAKLEGSKGFMKDLCVKYNIPTAAYERFYDSKSAKKYIEEIGAPIVVKEDGLAAGKGVTIAYSIEEALLAIENIFSNNQSLSPNGLVVEEFLTGQELSYFVLVDGINALPLAGAQDHKKVGDRDTGPNTGGMGAFAPSPIFSVELENTVVREIVTPTLNGMRLEGSEYRGVLYVGLMLTHDGPQVIEFNVRFGDPEAQVVLPMIESDLAPDLFSAAAGDLGDCDWRLRRDPHVGVVMASGGYPGSYEVGFPIAGLERATSIPGVHVVHAGTALQDDAFITKGGRVLTVVSRGSSYGEAVSRAYEAVGLIDFQGSHVRTDIGQKALS